MADPRAHRRFSDRLTSRRGAWLSLGLVLLIMTALFGAFGSAEAPDRNDQAPPGAESTRASELLAEFPDADRQSVLGPRRPPPPTGSRAPAPPPPPPRRHCHRAISPSWRVSCRCSRTTRTLTPPVRS